MSRSSKKFLPLYELDLKRYFIKLTNFKSLTIKSFSRRTSLNFWHINNKYSIYQGRYYSIHDFTETCLGYKAGSFTKTRKPFFFRSKKKR